MKTAIGSRVGAIMDMDYNTIRVFGFGVYAGDEVPPPEIKVFGKSLADGGITNPRINLDNGKTVWGCECWWGPEEKVRKQIEGRNVIEVDIDNARSEASTTKEQEP